MKRIAVLLIALTGGTLYFTGCGQNRGEGYRLAETHCQSCHQLPQPEWLDKKTWFNHVLPKMGGLLGFRYLGNGSYFENGSTAEVMPLTDWNKLVTYYVSHSPDSLQRDREQAIETGLNKFVVHRPAFTVKEPTTTYTGIIPGQQQFFIGDAVTQRLFRMNASGALMDSIRTEQGVVQVRSGEKGLWLLSMGVLYPSDEKKGALTIYNEQHINGYKLLDSLQRPVYVEYADLDNDGLEDIVICEFGNTTGQLSWYKAMGNNTYQKKVLRALPGAIRTKVLDLNKDGKPDIMALMAQGDESVLVYYNQGGGRFTEKRVLQLPPTYGSNYFELADFNGDGFPDILATNGDNGDYPPVLKPYHGIRIYLNDGGNNFRETVFLPMNGAGKAMAADFDQDGDLDIAAISYFPDYDHQPEESFLYWENTGGFVFRPFSPKEASLGRWLTMDVGDLDADGDVDIILGNAKFTLGYIPDWLMNQWDRYAPSVLILENRQQP